MRNIKHSSVSAPPVETAMSGMLSSGLVTVPGSFSDLSGCALDWHADTLIVSERRHLPT